MRYSWLSVFSTTFRTRSSSRLFWLTIQKARPQANDIDSIEVLRVGSVWQIGHEQIAAQQSQVRILLPLQEYPGRSCPTRSVVLPQRQYKETGMKPAERCRALHGSSFRFAGLPQRKWSNRQRAGSAPCSYHALPPVAPLSRRLQLRRPAPAPTPAPAPAEPTEPEESAQPTAFARPRRLSMY